MIFDSDREIRKMGYRKILHSREFTEVTFGILREYALPPILFDCQNYCELIDWNFPYTEPPFTRLIALEELEKLAESGDSIESDFTEVPCHTQATERHIRTVTQASMAVGSKAHREGMIATTLSARAKRPKFESKKDYQKPV